MSSFFSYFAGQRKEDENRISWSRFYEDFGGQGTMTTATRPMFSLKEHGPRRGKLLGVLGFDLPLGRLSENDLKYEEVVGQIASDIGQCDVYPIDPCQLQVIDRCLLATVSQIECRLSENPMANVPTSFLNPSVTKTPRQVVCTTQNRLPTGITFLMKQRRFVRTLEEDWR